MDAKRPPTLVEGVLLRLSQKLFIMREKAARDLARMVDANGCLEARKRGTEYLQS